MLAENWHRQTMRFLKIATLSTALAGYACSTATFAKPISHYYANCPAIMAEISVNKERVNQLMASRGPTQNGAANIAGMFVPLLWFTDFQDTAGTELTVLQNRRRHLLILAERKRCRF